MFLFTSRQTNRILKNPIIAGILRSVVTQPMSQSASDSNVKTEEETLAGGFGLTESGDDSGVEQESDFFFFISLSVISGTLFPSRRPAGITIPLTSCAKATSRHSSSSSSPPVYFSTPVCLRRLSAVTSLFIYGGGGTHTFISIPPTGF